MASRSSFCYKMDMPEPVDLYQGPALDLVHLSHQSLGDPALERELLALFDAQARQIVHMLHTLSSGNSNTARIIHNLAQTLKGSAQAVGARHVARAAEALEYATAHNAVKHQMTAHVAGVEAAVAETGDSLSDILRA